MQNWSAHNASGVGLFSPLLLSFMVRAVFSAVHEPSIRDQLRGVPMYDIELLYQRSMDHTTCPVFAPFVAFVCLLKRQSTRATASSLLLCVWNIDRRKLQCKHYLWWFSGLLIPNSCSLGSDSQCVCVGESFVAGNQAITQWFSTINLAFSPFAWIK